MSDIEDFDFVSDSDDNGINLVIENDLNTILEAIRKYIISNENFKKINLKFDIIKLKYYKGMVFLKVKDDTAFISSVIYKSVYQNDLINGDKIKICAYLDSYRGQLQLIIKSYEKIGIVDNTKFLLIKNKLQKMGYLDN